MPQSQQSTQFGNWSSTIARAPMSMQVCPFPPGPTKWYASNVSGGKSLASSASVDSRMIGGLEVTASNRTPALLSRRSAAAAPGTASRLSKPPSTANWYRQGLFGLCASWNTESVSRGPFGRSRCMNFRKPSTYWTSTSSTSRATRSRPVPWGRLC